MILQTALNPAKDPGLTQKIRCWCLESKRRCFFILEHQQRRKKLVMKDGVIYKNEK